ncbi:hypothetical protein Pcaca05_03370 [Pectobacterium carotovorum subsp. carotovorum]|nr:hypothetical protein Pcaca05_03370 [Pectobacterium carotovorum subsp. carotovorum]
MVIKRNLSSFIDILGSLTLFITLSKMINIYTYKDNDPKNNVILNGLLLA